MSLIILPLLFSWLCNAELSAWSTQAIDNLEVVAQATWKIKSKYIDHQCSGFFISNDGYLLTNIHCLTECFRNNDLWITSDETTDYEPLVPYRKTEDHSLYLTKQPSEKPFTCKDITASHPKYSYFFGSPQLISWGKGWGTLSSLRIDQVSEDNFWEFIHNVEDYALLKFNTKSQIVPCLEPAQENLSTDTVYAFGFPFEKDNGFKTYYSAGKIFSNLTLDDYLESIDLSPLARERHTDINKQGRWVRSSTTLNSGMSGGPLVNSEGKYIGINYSKNKPGAENTPRGTSFSQKFPKQHEFHCQKMAGN